MPSNEGVGSGHYRNKDNAFRVAWCNHQMDLTQSGTEPAYYRVQAWQRWD